MSEAQIAGGHKANLNNSNTSQESKEHSKAVLENEFDGGNGEFISDVPSTYHLTYNDYLVPHAGDKADKNPGNVAGGLKA